MTPETLENIEEPVVNGPTVERVGEVKIPDPVGRMTEAWFVVGYGALEVPMMEDKPPETLGVWVLDLEDFVFVLEWWCDPVPVAPTVAVEFGIEYGGIVSIPMPVEVANPPDTVDAGPVPVNEIGPVPVPVAPIALDVKFSGNGGAEELDGALGENPEEYGEEPVEVVDN
jgi:hypothetical protein